MTTDRRETAQELRAEWAKHGDSFGGTERQFIVRMFATLDAWVRRANETEAYAKDRLEQAITERARYAAYVLKAEHLAAQVERLQRALVECAVPYEALLLDGGSRKWIAPEVWTAIENAVIGVRAALTEGHGE